MRRALPFILFLWTASAFAQIAVQYSPADFTGYVPGAQQVQITPLWNYTASGTNIVHGGDRKFSTGTIIDSFNRTHTGTPGTLIVSNVLYGAYRVDFYLLNNPSPVATFTNVFTNGTPSFVNGKDYFGVSTNSVLENGYAYTIAQVNALIANIPSGTNGGDVSGPGASTVGELPYYDQTTGKHLARSGVIYTNVFLNTQMALSNALYRAQFASTNFATLTIPGLILPDGITLVIDPTTHKLSSVATGTGDFVGPSGATSGNIVIFGSGTGKLGGDSGHALSEYTPLSQIASGAQNGLLSSGDWTAFNNKPTTSTAVLTNDTRNVTFGGTHTNLGGVILPVTLSANTNAAVTESNAVQQIFNYTTDMGQFAGPDTNLVAIGTQTNAVQVQIGTGLKWTNLGPGTNRLDVTVTGGSSVFSVTNVIVSTTNEVLLDLANYNVFKLFSLTNMQWKLTNASSLTQKAYIYYQQDTNGGRLLNAYSVAAGLVQTNANMQPTTNASALDVLEILPGFFTTNVVAYWLQNFQPRVPFTNSLSTGGGGGGAGTFAFVRSTNANAATSTPAVITVDTTGATVGVLTAAWYDGVGTNMVSTAGTFTLVTQHGSSSGTESNAIWVCTSLTSPGAGKTITFTADYPNINLALYSLSSGTAAVDLFGGTNRTEGSTIGSIPLSPGAETPSVNNCLIVGSATWDNTGVTVSSVAGTTNIREQHQQGGNSVSVLLSDVIQTTAAGVTPIATLSASTINACSGSFVIIKPQ